MNNISNEERSILEIAVKTLDSKKASDLKVIKIGNVSSLANYFVIASGTSSTQVKTLADETEAKLKEAGYIPELATNHRGSEWVVLDYIDVVVHIFYTEARSYYELDRLWEDGELIDADEFLG